MNEEFRSMPNIVNLKHHGVCFTSFPDLNTHFSFLLLFIKDNFKRIQNRVAQGISMYPLPNLDDRQNVTNLAISAPPTTLPLLY